MTSWWAPVLGAALLLCALLPSPGLAADPPTGGAEEAQTLLDEAEQLAVSEVDKAVARARPLLDRYGYPAVFAAVFVEGVGIPGPGETLLIAGAIDAAHGSLNIVVVLLLAVLGAVLGNSLGYLIGRVGGRALLRKLPISEARLARVEALFERYGAGFIVIARFIDGPRQLNGVMAGTLEMPWWRFSLWNLCGALLWVGVWGLGVYWLDRDLDQILALVERIEPLAIALSVAALLAGAIYIWHRHRNTNDTR
jgi:membrane protein DedA with SNARE-associated domain